MVRRLSHPRAATRTWREPVGSREPTPILLGCARRRWSQSPPASDVCGRRPVTHACAGLSSLGLASSRRSCACGVQPLLPTPCRFCAKAASPDALVLSSQVRHGDPPPPGAMTAPPMSMDMLPFDPALLFLLLPATVICAYVISYLGMTLSMLKGDRLDVPRSMKLKGKR